RRVAQEPRELHLELRGRARELVGLLVVVETDEHLPLAHRLSRFDGELLGDARNGRGELPSSFEANARGTRRVLADRHDRAEDQRGQSRADGHAVSDARPSIVDAEDVAVAIATSMVGNCFCAKEPLDTHARNWLIPSLIAKSSSRPLRETRSAARGHE